MDDLLPVPQKPLQKDPEVFHMYVGPYSYTGKKLTDAQKVLEESVIKVMLHRFEGNKSFVARALGISRAKVMRIFDRLPEEQRKQLINKRYACLRCGEAAATLNNKYCRACDAQVRKEKKHGN